MRIEHVFLDNGGVITDNSRRGPQYQKLVGEYFAPRLGGSAEAWAAANAGIVPGVWQRFLARVEGWHAGRDIQREMLLYYADWLRVMYARMGVEAPADDLECGSFARSFDYWVNPQIDARFPGVDSAIAALASRFRLFAASDGFSLPLAVAIGPGAPLFERLYGPDLVNVPKSAGRAYYEAIFAHAGVDPAQALVVDDNAANLLAARAAGARTVRVGAGGVSSPDEPVVAALAELPALIDTL